MSKRPRFNCMSPYCFHIKLLTVTKMIVPKQQPFWLIRNTRGSRFLTHENIRYIPYEACISRHILWQVSCSRTHYSGQRISMMQFYPISLLPKRKYITTTKTLKWTILRKYSKHVDGLIPLKHWAHTFKPHSIHRYVSMSPLCLIRVCLTNNFHQ
jgi:hypothetical protein